MSKAVLCENVRGVASLHEAPISESGYRRIFVYFIRRCFMKVFFKGALFTVVLFFTCIAARADEEIPLTATASSSYQAGYTPGRAVDGDTATYWLTFLTRPEWIRFDAGDIFNISDIRVIWYSSIYAPTNFDIQISDDDVTWETLYTGLTGVVGDGADVRAINRKTRYIRLHINEAWNYAIIRECFAYAVISVPSTVRFRGTLRDSQGALLDGSHTLKFRLYKTADDVSEVPTWTETHQSVAISNGLLEVELGSVTPLDVSFATQYWLGVEVGTDGEMVPRFKLTAVPFALKAKE